MIPRQREMVEQLKDRPFTLLGINSDPSRSALKKILKKEKITWPNIYGGHFRMNAIAQRWAVENWPTIYIIDHEGIIRAKDPRNMEKKVMSLLKKIPQGG